MDEEFISFDATNEGNINEKDIELAIKLFNKKGFLCLRKVFDTDLIDGLQKELIEKYLSKKKINNKYNWFVQKDEKRIQTTLGLKGIFSNPNIYGSKIVLKILNQLFSINGVTNENQKEQYKKYIIDSYTVITSLPNCSEQQLHSDGGGLFGSAVDNLLPPHAILLGIPLINLDNINGTTEIFPKNNLKNEKFINEQQNSLSCKPFLKKGDCYLMDFRTIHRGLANNSNKKRSILFVRYCLPWWRDIANYRRKISSKHTVSPIRIDNSGLSSIPEHLKYLFRYYGNNNS